MKMNKKGVTLIELIIVIVIIAIGAVLAVPNLGPWLANYRLRTATRDIASTLRVAQMKAVSSNMQYRVNLNAVEVGANSYILQRNTNGVWVNDGAIQTLPTGITINLITFPNSHAEFNPNSTSSTGSMTLINTKKTTKKITLSPSTGRIKIE